MKKLLPVFILSAVLTSCSSNYENYYLKEYSVNQDVQGKKTSGEVLDNLVYAKVLDKKSAKSLFGPDISDKIVVYFYARNMGRDTAFFNFDNVAIMDESENKQKRRTAFSKLVDDVDINLNKKSNYMNPFEKAEMDENNFAYNLNNKILTDFSLDSGMEKYGYLIFDDTKYAEYLKFHISSGSSIYTSRDYKLKLDVQQN